MSDMETLSKLYLELANVVPADCISSREIRLGKIADKYGLALRMIAEGCDGPADLAARTLAIVAGAKPLPPTPPMSRTTDDARS